MHGCMVHGRMDGWMYGGTEDGRTDGRTERGVDGWTEKGGSEERKARRKRNREGFAGKLTLLMEHKKGEMEGRWNTGRNEERKKNRKQGMREARRERRRMQQGMEEGSKEESKEQMKKGIKAEELQIICVRVYVCLHACVWFHMWVLVCVSRVA